MSELGNNHPRRPLFVLTLGSFVLIIASLYWAQKIIIPLTLAILLSFLLSPSVSWLQRHGVGRIPAVILVVVVSFSLLAFICWGIAEQVRSLLDEIPQHRHEIAAKLSHLQTSGPGPVSNIVGMVNDISEKIETDASRLADGHSIQPVLVVNNRSPTLSWVATAAGTAFEFGVSCLFMIILVVFLLARREDLRNRFFKAVGHGQLAVMTRAIDMAAQRISSYLMTQLLINVCFGVFWSMWLFLVPNGEGGHGVPHALLWGALLVALRFIPYLGTWVALAFPLLLSVALSPLSHPLFQPLLIASVFVALELFVANVLEPVLIGHNTGVSPVALLIAAVFWAWLWGPIGLVLSTPITACLVVLGKHIPHLELFNVFFGDEPPTETETSYYQRLLVRDEDEATEIVQAHLKDKPEDSIYDELLLPALALAKQDAEQGRLGQRDEQFIMEVTRRIVEEIIGHEQRARTLAAGQSQSNKPNREKMLALGCPARGELDELALLMIAQLLDAKGYRMEVLSSQMLSSEVVEKIGDEAPTVVCISALPPGGLAQASYLCKRLLLHYPDLKIIVGRWGQQENVEKMKERLMGAGATAVVPSLLEMRREVLSMVHLTPAVPSSNTSTPQRSSVLAQT